MVVWVSAIKYKYKVLCAREGGRGGGGHEPSPRGGKFLTATERWWVFEVGDYDSFVETERLSLLSSRLLGVFFHLLFELPCRNNMD